MVIFHGSVSLPKVELVYNWLNGGIYVGHMIYIYILYIYMYIYIYTYGFGTLSFLLDKHEDLSHKYTEIDQKNGVWSSHVMRILKTWLSKSPSENGLRTIPQELHQNICTASRESSTTNITWVPSGELT